MVKLSAPTLSWKEMKVGSYVRSLEEKTRRFFQNWFFETHDYIMAVAGLAFGGLGIVGLFNNAVACFEYVQLGRHFKQDFKTCYLQLDCARLRLSRWGRSVGIDDNVDEAAAAALLISEDQEEMAKDVLNQIIELFDDAKDKADRYNSRAQLKGQQLVVYSDKDLDKKTLGLHEKMRQLSISRQGIKSLAKRVGWALHEERRFRTLIFDIKELVADLITLFPAAVAMQKDLCEAEVKELDKEEAAPMLLDIAKEEDALLAETLANAVKPCTTTYHISFEGSRNNYGLQIGHNSGGTINYNGTGFGRPDV